MYRRGLDHRAAWRDEPVEPFGRLQRGNRPAFWTALTDGHERAQMAFDGGLAGAGFPANSAALAWLRLPLQIPLILWATSVARSNQAVS